MYNKIYYTPLSGNLQLSVHTPRLCYARVCEFSVYVAHGGKGIFSFSFYSEPWRGNRKHTADSGWLYLNVMKNLIRRGFLPKYYQIVKLLLKKTQKENKCNALVLHTRLALSDIMFTSKWQLVALTRFGNKILSFYSILLFSDKSS